MDKERQRDREMQWVMKIHRQNWKRNQRNGPENSDFVIAAKQNEIGTICLTPLFPILFMIMNSLAQLLLNLYHTALNLLGPTHLSFPCTLFTVEHVWSEPAISSYQKVNLQKMVSQAINSLALFDCARIRSIFWIEHFCIVE